MKKIIYISLLASLLFSCINNESKISNEKLDNKSDSSDKIIDKDFLIININENASKTPIQELDTIDSLMILFFPNADKDSLIASIDSAIFLFLNDVAMPGHDELKKIEKERNKILKSIDKIEDWEDGADYNLNCEGIASLYLRLSELSFGKEKESALRNVLNFSDCLFDVDETENFSFNLNALCELLKLQIHHQYPIKKTLENINDLYIRSLGIIEYILDKDEGEEIIYLRRLLDLYYSGKLNKYIIPRDSKFQEKASVSDTVFNNKLQLSAEEKNMLSNLLSESSIVKLEQALHTLYSTDKDWEVIQSFIELAAIKDSLNLLAKDEDEEFGIESILLEKSGIGFKNCHIHDEYQCGFTISFDVYSERASLTSGKADDDFFDFLSYHSDGALHDNDKFGAWMAGADFYRTWFLGKGAFLNYFKKETSLVKKHKIYNEEFNELSTEHIKDLKKIIEKIHDDAIDYIFYDPRKEDDMGICCNKNEVIEELNQILAANVLTESENKKLKIHVENLSNDNSPWLQWSFDNE